MNDHGQGCFPSIPNIGTSTGLKERAVFYNIKLAEESGFLIRKKRYGNGQKWASNEYIAAYPKGVHPDAGVHVDAGTPGMTVESSLEGCNIAAEMAVDTGINANSRLEEVALESSLIEANSEVHSNAYLHLHAPLPGMHVDAGMHPDAPLEGMHPGAGVHPGAVKGCTQVHTNSPINSPIKKERKKVSRDPSEFENFWGEYGRIGNKLKAEKAFQKIKGVDYARIIEGLRRYQAQCQALGTEQKFIKHASTWLNSRGWEDEHPIHARSGQFMGSNSQTQPTKHERMLRAAGLTNTGMQEEPRDVTQNSSNLFPNP